MTPSTHTETIPEFDVQPETQPAAHVETLVLETPKPKKVPAPARAVPSASRYEIGTFQSSIIEANRIKSGSKLLDIAISLTVNLTLLAAPILAGLYFTDTINLKQFAATFLVAPPPPPPPPPAPAAVVVRSAAPTHRVFENAGKLLAPALIPKNIAEIKEAPLPMDSDSAGMIGGVPGGVAGGSMGGVIGGVIGGVKTAAAMPIAPKENKPKEPVRVGGRVREPELIKRVEPNYPELARQTHLAGVVLIDAIIDENGNVVEMKVVSGHPLLLQSALNAVRQWKYKPTYLNDMPVPVQLIITVTFRLN
jgi:protein TonB